MLPLGTVSQLIDTTLTDLSLWLFLSELPSSTVLLSLDSQNQVNGLARGNPVPDSIQTALEILNSVDRCREVSASVTARMAENKQLLMQVPSNNENNYIFSLSRNEAIKMFENL
jgi:hypothetical protein